MTADAEPGASEGERSIEQHVTVRGWRAGHKLAFRFVCVYLVLYNLPFPLDLPPRTSWIDDAAAWCWHKLGILVGDVVFGTDLTGFSNPTSGDTAYDYVLVFTFVVLAAIAALAWTALDRKRIDYRRLDAALRVYIRYLLAFIMMSYGVSKVFKTQFPSPTPDRLQETYGESSPMGLLWTMMGYSGGYNLFTGMVEVIGGGLLFWRRTTLLGALITAGALANVVMLNFCYDVPVKLYSTHLLLMVVYILAPDLGRLAGFLVLDRTVAARPPRTRLPRRLEWARLGVKTLFIGYVSYMLIDEELDARSQRNDAPIPDVYGIYLADTYVAGGVSHPPLVTDGPRWRSISFNQYGETMVRRMDATSVRFNATFDPATHLVSFAPYTDETPTTMLYAPRDADHLTLVGVFDHQPLLVTATRKDAGDTLLMSRGFHWINAYSYNR